MDYWVVSVRHRGVERNIHQTLYATPFQAQTAVERAYRSRSSYEFGVRLATWKERETVMFLEGQYQHPVWVDEDFWEEAHALKAQHFTHISSIDPSAIAFTEDERKGEADRQTMMRPGKYLQKFFGAGPEGVIEHGPYKGEPPRITKQKVAFYAAWHQAGARPPSEDILEITEDENRMVEAYEEGPDSCMMGKGWEFANHPVRVYSGGGLALALLLSHASGEVIGRALCWPAREVFGRVYPTPTGALSKELYDELMARLKAKGWTSIEEDKSVFEGALLRQMTNRWGTMMMPYLDHEYGVEDVYRDGKSWWRMTHDEPHQDSTDGEYSNPEPDWTCESCDEGQSEDNDSYTVYGGWRQLPGQRYGHGRHEMQWCESCREYNAFWCDGAEEYFTEDVGSVEVGYRTYAEPWFQANGGWTCDHSGEHYLREDDPPVVLANGMQVHPDVLEECAFRCLWEGTWQPLDWMSDVTPGYAADLDLWPVHPVEMEFRLPDIPPDEALAASLTMALTGPPAEALGVVHDQWVDYAQRVPIRRTYEINAATL